MASGSSPVMDDDELKGDGKKRKFKPFEAVRKFFGKGKRKAKDEQVSVVTIKAKSTTALHHHHYRDDDDEDDDDGGFKNRQPRPLGGNRSISEDSVFSPETREPNLQALKKAAVSEESLPKSAFQAELFSKLNKRRSQYSDEDDGLPHSPTPPVTTADIIMGGPLKPLPAAGKSTSRESDNSLISNDVSENEEDDPFKSQWKSSVPSKVSKNPGTSGGGSEAPIDFESMSHTELLKSDIAKDRISVKPRSRKTNRQSRKKREGQSPHSLPSLNEESPPKSRADTASTSSTSESQADSAGKQEISTKPSKPPGSPVDKAASSTPRHQLTKQSSESSPTALRPTSTPVSPGPVKPIAVAEQERREKIKDEEEKQLNVKSDLKSATLKEDEKQGNLKTDLKSSLKEDDKRTNLKSDLRSPTSKGDNSITKASFDFGKSETEKEPGFKALTTSKTMDSVKSVSESSSFEGGKERSSVMSRSQQFESSSSKSSGTFEASSSSAKPKVEFLSSSIRSTGSQGSSSPHHSAIHTHSESQTTSHTAHSSTAVRTADNISSSSAPSKPTSTSATSPGESKREGLRQTDSQTSPAFSPKDDYKLRRQSRSKTLPDQPTVKEEPFATKVQRAASHRVEATSSQNASPEASPRHREKVVETSKSKEPEWFALARRKTGRQDSEEKKDLPSPIKETAPAKEPVSTSDVPVSSASGPKVDAVSCSVETSGNMSVSSASSMFGRFVENKSSEVSRVRGGSVKTSPTKTHVFANRGSSVKAQSGRNDSGATGTSVTASSALKTTTPVSSALASSTVPGAKQEAIKEESKSPESSPSREVPKWKTQSVKTSSAFSSSTSSVASSSRFSSVKTSSQPTPASITSTSVTKTETRPTSSPAKKPPLTKTPSEEKEKANVPAWRANLSQKKPPVSDIKIELIETPSSSSGTKKEDSAKKEEVTMRVESPTKASAASKDVPSDQCRSSATPSRASKVMNLLKNFENVQGVS